MPKFTLPSKAARDLVKELKDDGWEAVGVARGSTHVIMRHKDGAKAQIPSTPSGHRSMKNAKKRLQRLAATPPRPRTKPA